VIVADLEEIVSEQCSAAEARVAEGSISVVHKVMIRLGYVSRLGMYVCACVYVFGPFQGHLGRFRGTWGASEAT
jgi:hypothetical protein